MVMVPASVSACAAAGVTGIARTTGAALASYFAGLCFARPALWDTLFFIAGALKIAYDLLLYRSFVRYGRREAETSLREIVDGRTPEDLLGSAEDIR